MNAHNILYAVVNVQAYIKIQIDLLILHIHLHYIYKIILFSYNILSSYSLHNNERQKIEMSEILPEVFRE